VTASTDRLAVSSLGAPHASLADFINIAVTGQCGAVELRCADDQPVHLGLSPTQRGDIRRRLSDAGLQVLAVASYVRVAAPGDSHAVVGSLRRHVELAHQLGAHGVRVFPGGSGDQRRDDERALIRLSQVASEARQARVRLLVETHDSHPCGQDVARVLAALDTEVPEHGVGAIWDILHPWRHAEVPSRTFTELAPWLDYVQIKDATSCANPVPTLMGDGVVPLADIAATMRQQRYDGWLSLEWEKAWHPDIADLDRALASARSWVASA